MLNLTDDLKAFEQVKRCDPRWSGMCRVRDVLLHADQLLLHAGPPFTSAEQIPPPVMNSLCIGAIYEGWAEDYAQARDAILAGEIAVAPAQDHDIVVPLAGVASPSMALMVVTNANQPTHRKYAVINEGMVHCTRLGKLDPDLPDHLRWLNGELAEWLGYQLLAPIALLPMISAALEAGDDCHGRTLVGSELLAETLLGVQASAAPAAIRDFLHSSPAFALNVWMAASSLLLSAAEGSENSSLITRAGGNGVSFGVQVAARPGQWICMPAPEVKGAVDDAFAGYRALGAIGDSAVVDFLGLGGQVLNTATASREALCSYLPDDALSRPKKALTAALARLPERLVITGARQVVNQAAGPLILLGMIEQTGTAGRIGGGVVDVPATFFQHVLSEAGLC
ncbi:DUF1116 domain-containing protein [Pontibacterium granulatum]|uniref:oxamate carbamoyltransferase subunit AllG family protein n=1 Tax=Pontibacterium granulatum TaxID=2036029 RepID=UPI00249C833C|nr:DUF1116 domain-containing protein [Pontibacterium granulatum]MDI3325197.1 DUF1116 domain-containing protein [Pontibacterium granulatum]